MNIPVITKTETSTTTNNRKKNKTSRTTTILIKERSTKDKLKKSATSLLVGSNIHGLSKIITRKRIAFKIVWLMLLILSALLCINYVVKNIVEFFRLNRRYEEAEKSYSQNNKTTLTILETKEDYEIDKQQYNVLKLLRDIFQLFSTTEVYILNSPSGKEFYVKTNSGAYFNIATEQLNTNITLTDLYAVPLEDFPFEIYFYDFQ